MNFNTKVFNFDIFNSNLNKGIKMENLKKVKALLVGKLAGLAARKVVLFRKLRINRMMLRIEALEKVISENS